MGLFSWFRKKAPPAAEPAGCAPGLPLPDRDLDEAIAAIAALRSPLAVQERARDLSRQYGPDVVPELRRRFDVMIEPPPSFSAREPSVCAWANCWCFALF